MSFCLHQSQMDQLSNVVHRPTITHHGRKHHPAQPQRIIAVSVPITKKNSRHRHRHNTFKSDGRADAQNTSEFSSSSPPATQFMALFRRRASNASEVSNVELKKETQNVYRLYALAVDELNFAEDSRGSPYYAGDLVTAREAIDECAGAFMRLLQQIPDHSMRTQLQAAITPRLLNLQEKFNALPPESSLLSL